MAFNLGLTGIIAELPSHAILLILYFFSLFVNKLLYDTYFFFTSFINIVSHFFMQPIISITIFSISVCQKSAHMMAFKVISVLCFISMVFRLKHQSDVWSLLAEVNIVSHHSVYLP